jgi:hypothetical protein
LQFAFSSTKDSMAIVVVAMKLGDSLGNKLGPELGSELGADEGAPVGEAEGDVVGSNCPLHSPALVQESFHAEPTSGSYSTGVLHHKLKGKLLHL